MMNRIACLPIVVAATLLVAGCTATIGPYVQNVVPQTDGSIMLVRCSAKMMFFGNTVTAQNNVNCTTETVAPAQSIGDVFRGSESGLAPSATPKSNDALARVLVSSAWRFDPTDPDAQTMLGQATLVFAEDGTLFVDARDGLAIRRTRWRYHVEPAGVWLEPPSGSSDRIDVELSRDGVLALSRGGTRSRFVRVVKEPVGATTVVIPLH
jgi:hypothetical protein